MRKKTFKKFEWVIFGLILGLIFGINAAFADNGDDSAPAKDEPKKLKVYLSEPIGAGKEVFHVTQCPKIWKKVPLRCNESTAKDEKYKTICNAPNKKTNEMEVLTGKYIEKCLEPEGADPSDEKVCKKKEFIEENVWAVTGCRKDRKGECKPGVLEYVVARSDAAGEKPSRNPYDPDKTFIEKYGGDKGDYDNIDVQRVYEIGGTVKDKPEVEAPGCIHGDFDVKKNKEWVKETGTLTVFPSKLNGECKSINQELVGNEEDAISCSRMELIQGSSGTGLIAEFIGGIYRWAASIVGVIAVLVMVISGIQISMAGGDSAKVDAAKTRIMESIAGLVILFLSGLILYTINPNFFT